MKRLGIKTVRLNIILILIKNMANPNGMLIPGMDTGSKKGAVKITQDMKRPRSPITSRKSFKVIPSPGIFEEISDIKTENCSSPSNLSDNLNNPKNYFILLLLLFKSIITIPY